MSVADVLLCCSSWSDEKSRQEEMEEPCLLESSTLDFLPHSPGLLRNSSSSILVSLSQLIMSCPRNFTFSLVSRIFCFSRVGLVIMAPCLSCLECSLNLAETLPWLSCWFHDGPSPLSRATLLNLYLPLFTLWPYVFHVWPLPLCPAQSSVNNCSGTFYPWSAPLRTPPSDSVSPQFLTHKPVASSPLNPGWESSWWHVSD